MQDSTDKTGDGFRRGFTLVAVVLVSALFLYMIRGYIEALIIAAVFGAIIRPVYLRILSRVDGRESIASGLTLVGAILVVILPVTLFLVVLAEQAHEIVNDLAPKAESSISASESLQLQLPEWMPYRDQLDPYSETISGKLAEWAAGVGQWLVASLSSVTRGTASFFINLFIMLYALYFYLISGPEMIRRAMRYLPLDPDDRTRLLDVARSVSSATVKGTLVIAIIQGFLGGVSLAIAGVPGAALWASLMAVMSVIPGIGPSIVWGPIVAYLLFQGDLVTAGLLFAWNALVVGTIDNLLRPRLVGQETQMPDLLILLSTLGGLTLLGASGIIIGPVIAGLFLTVWTIYASVFRDSLSRVADE